MSAAQLVTLLRDGAAVRLGETEFGNAMEPLRDEHSAAGDVYE